MRKNLLPTKFNKGYIYEFVKVMINTNIIVGIGFAGFYTYYYLENKDIEKEIDVAEVKIETENNETADRKVRLKRDEFYEAFIDKKTKKENGELQVEKDFSYNLFVYKINKIIPSSIKLSNVTYINESEISISGQSSDFHFVSEFYQNLLSNEIISKGHLEHIEVIPSIKDGNHAIKDVVYFEIKGGKEFEKSE